jgi:hypothetical protein
MFGKGYLSSVVTRFSFLKSPHGRHVPSFLQTMWRGLTQQLEERQMTPAASIFENSSLAAFSFTWSKRRNFRCDRAAGSLYVLLYAMFWRGRDCKGMDHCGKLIQDLLPIHGGGGVEGGL